MKHFIKEKQKVVINIFSFFLFVNFFLLGSLNSQVLNIELNPNYNLEFGTFTIKKKHVTQIKLNDKLGNRINFSQGSFGLDFTFIKFKKNINLGLSYLNGGAVTRLKFTYDSMYTDSISNPTAITKLIEKQGNSTSIRQFGAYVRFPIEFYKYKTYFTQNTLSFYLFYLVDRTNFVPLYDNFIELQDGFMSSNYQSYPEIYENKKGVSIMIRYDIGFTSKSKRNLFNFFVGFQQGFINMDYITLDVNHTNGAQLAASSISRGSFLNFGVSKPIKIWEGNKAHKKRLDKKTKIFSRKKIKTQKLIIARKTINLKSASSPSVSR